MVEARSEGSDRACVAPRTCELKLTDIPIGVVTISDRAFRGLYEDKGGPGIEAALRDLLRSPWRPVRQLVPDERPQIEATLASSPTSNAVLSSSRQAELDQPRDVTPEATEAVCDRLLPASANSCAQ